MKQDMKGFSVTWFEVCNADNHALVLQAENRFRSHEEAAEAAKEACVIYRDVVTVVEHVATIKRVFRADVKATEE